MEVDWVSGWVTAVKALGNVLPAVAGRMVVALVGVEQTPTVTFVRVGVRILDSK